MDKFFSNVSKYIIFVPIVITVLALIFKFGQTSKTIGQMVNKITPTPTTASKKINIDLNGPYQCLYKDNEGEYAVYIKNKQVLANVKTKSDTDKYFFDGDCLYADGVKKMCNLSPYLSLFEGAVGNNRALLNNLVGPYIKTGVDVEEILKTCKKEDFKDSVFD
ncbi:hypothetical protein A2970_00415 [Candidatus Roizmanbacteria bacterium RIFCSPLOWO2_01_FULL_44_13]|uniref:Uncharacterized protein n=1 Tax=Candidatus Roizmanbacteria bacterium RIFCSPLOWO2_01_FULL_44_13 TaxID=1802069 RepID=A0A1F7JBA8_9BACT|nr:MAG: hypothetical protein A2970_00415 [Candidatus Roizmanbacteria bacterium RIFCSPLOWO2_01_FULL_44_13]